MTGVTITYAGAVNSFTMTTSCTVAAAGNAGALSNGSPINLAFGTANKLTVARNVRSNIHRHRHHVERSHPHLPGTFN